MFHLKYPSQQSDPPRSPKETLPTMYDLPSEDLEEPGLPDEFHSLQPRLLDTTCRSPRYPADRMFKGADINLYYDVHHQLWYKRPDWFLVVDVERLYENTDLRLSYVIWQEGVTPLVMVEFLSPGTAAEDLGERTAAEDVLELADEVAQPDQAEAIDPLVSVSSATEDGEESAEREKPPRKWDVYERILRVPYYVVFSRYTNRMRVFMLQADRYQEVVLDPAQPRVWIPALELGLGLWQGEFEGIDRLWLRWYDAAGEWLPTEAEAERLEKERERLEKERERSEKERAEALLERERSEKEQALQRAAAAEALLVQEQAEKERLLERLRQLEGQ